LRLFDNGKL
jgi:hypothetical protein